MLDSNADAFVAWHSYFSFIAMKDLTFATCRTPFVRLKCHQSLTRQSSIYVSVGWPHKKLSDECSHDHGLIEISLLEISLRGVFC